MTPEARAAVRVVIADDVSALRRLVRLVLEAAGGFAVVGEARDGAEAIEVVRATRPDLVLLDLSMPRMDGLEALPQIRKVSPESKVVVFSGFIEDPMGRAAMELGATRYIEKGVHPDALVTALTEVMRATA